MLWRTLLCCLVLAGTVSAKYFENNHGYVYIVKASSWTGLHGVSGVSKGVSYDMKMELEAQGSKITGRISKTHLRELLMDEEGRIKSLNSGVQRITEIEKSFEISWEGNQMEIFCPEGTPMPVVNMMKGAFGLLNVDNSTLPTDKAKNSPSQRYKPSSGSSYTDKPNNGSSYIYKGIESLVHGECEMNYNKMPLTSISELQYPFLRLNPSSTPYYVVEKSTNFNRCRRSPMFHSNIQEPGQNVQQSLSRSHMGKVIINETKAGKALLVYAESQLSIAVPLELHGVQKGITWSNISIVLEKSFILSKQGARNEPVTWQSFGDLVYSSDPTQQQQILSPDLHKWRSASSSSSSSSSSSGSSSSSEGSNESSSSSSSSKGSSSSSSSSSSEESQTEAPGSEEYSKASYFGTAGALSPSYGIGTSQKTLVEILSNLAIKIAISSPEEATPLFIQLVEGVRLLDEDHLEVLYQQTSEDPINGNDATRVLRDAVAESGTYEALLSIYRWWRQERMSDVEAAQLVSVFEHSALIPDTHFMNKLWEMVEDQEVQHTAFLNVSSVITFTNLIRKVVVDKRNAHNSYPSHAVQLPTAKDLPVEKYIKHIAEKLDIAIEKDDSHKVLTYISALGNIGHKKILEYLTPFISGQKNVTEFQRWAIVTNLGFVAQLNPKYVLHILHQIFTNKGEAYETRLASLFNLMRSNVDADTLQKLAMSTQDEPIRHVHSAIHSAIHSIAEEVYGEYNQHRVRNAKSAVDLLRNLDHASDYSQILQYGNLARETLLGQDILIGSTNSRNSVLPKGLSLRSILNNGGFRVENLDLALMMSNVLQGGAELQNFINKFMNPDARQYSRNQHQRKSSGSQEKFEYLVKYDVWGGKGIAAGHSLEQTPLGYYLNNGIKKFHLHKIMVKVPNILGIPVHFTLTRAHHVAANFSRSVNARNAARHSFVVNAAYSSHTEAKIGFFVPFQNVSHSVGLVKTAAAKLPSGLKVSFNSDAKTNSITIEPRQNSQKEQLLHFSMVPFSTSESNLDFIPPLENPNTVVIHVARTKQVNHSFGKQLGIDLSFAMESDYDVNVYHGFFEQARGSSFWERFNNPFNILEEFKRYRGYDIFSFLSHPFAFDAIYYLNASLSLDVSNSKAKSVKLALATDWSQGEVPVPDLEAENIAWPQDREPLSQDRRQEYLQKASYLVGNDAWPAALVVDGVVSFGKEPVALWAFTAAYGSNVANHNVSVLLYNKLQLQSQEPFEMAIDANWGATQVSLFELDYNIRNPPQGTFNVQLNYINGAEDVQEGELILSGEMSISKQRLQDLLNSPIAKQCKQQMKQNYKIQYACKELQCLAATFDNYVFEAKYQLPTSWKQQTYSLYSYIRHLFYIHIQEDWFSQRKQPQNTLRLEMDLNGTRFDASLLTPSFNAYFIGLPIGPGAQLLQRIAANAIVKKHAMHTLPLYQEATCVVDHDTVNTFDNTTYQVQFRERQKHILLALDAYDAEHQLTIAVARRGKDGLLLDIYVQNTHIRTWNTGGQQLDELQLEVNGTIQYVPINSVYSIGASIQVHKRLISELSIVFNDPYIQRIEFSGDHVLVFARNALRQKTKGLCGRFTGESILDFTVAPNCVVKNAADFADSFIEGSGDIPKSKCIDLDTVIKTGTGKQPVVIRQGVSSSSESSSSSSSSSESSEETNAGARPRVPSTITASSSSESTEATPLPPSCTIHSTLAVFEEGKICFSKRPVPTCHKGCRSLKKQTKAIRFVCLPRNEMSLEMLNKVSHQGYVDFSKMPPTMSRNVTVDYDCRFPQ